MMYKSKKFIKNNFLNLSCALSCVIHGGDCSAIVFLYVNFYVAFCLISNFKHSVQEFSARFLRVHRNEKG